MEKIRRAQVKDAETLALLAIQMWEDHEVAELADEFREIVEKDDAVCFITFAEDRPVAFAQCQLRYDYVEGTESSPVGYLEGIFVSEDLSKPLGAARLFQKACDLASGLSAIVNNAAMFAPADELPPETEDALRRVNSETPEKLTALLGLRLMEHPPFRGAVVNLLDYRILASSVSGEKETPYLASKKALRVSMEKSVGFFADPEQVAIESADRMEILFPTEEPETPASPTE